MNARTRSNEMKVGGLLLLALAVFAWLSIQIGAFQGFGETIRVHVTFNNASGLVVDSAVKIAGVEIGRVSSLMVDFDVARAELELQAEAAIRSDVVAQVRSRSLLGEKYVALTPRSKDAPAAKDGDELSSLPSVEIDDLITALGPLLGEVNPADVARLTSSLADISSTMSAESSDLVGKVQTLLDRLNEAAEVAPVIKEEVPALMKDLRRTVKDTRRVVGETEEAIADARALMKELNGAAKGAPALVDDLQAAVDAVEPGLDDLRRAMETADSAAKSLDQLLAKWRGFDPEELRRLLREEGVLVRLTEPRKKKKD